VEAGLTGKGDFPQLGIGLYVLGPGEPMAMYHWETDQEDFLVLSGEALLVIEGEERQLRRWDFVHCSAGTRHVIVGPETRPAPSSPSARENVTPAPDGTLQGREDWGAYTVDEAAAPARCGRRGGDDRRGAGIRPVSKLELTRYRDGWLSG